MADKQKEENKYFGFTGPQALVGVFLLVVIASLAGYGPWADNADALKSDVNGTQTIVTGAADVELNSAFVSVIANVTNTVSDVDTNYNAITDVIALQFDTKITASGGNTTFLMSTKNIAGTTIELINYTETGTLTEPVTDQTVPMIVNIDLSVLGGFDNSDQVAYTTVSAEAGPQLLTTAGVKYYPISTRSTDSTKPSVKIDTVLDSTSFSWLASTTTQSIDITFDVSLTGVSKMNDISDKISIPIYIEGGDDSPITVELIRVDAIIS